MPPGQRSRLLIGCFHTQRNCRLTDDDASDGAGLQDVPRLLGEHALAALQQGNVAAHVLAVGDLSAAAVGLGHGYEASHLHREEGGEGR